MAVFEDHPARRPAIVTGASSGIGEAVARTLAHAGHPVVLGARRVDRCAAIASDLLAEGADAVAIPLDLGEPESIQKFVVAADEALGSSEILVSNAGDVVPASAVEADPDAFSAEVEVNFLGAQRLAHLVVPGMIERCRGDVVFVSSDIVTQPRPHMAAYMSAKWALEGLARAMQMELEGTGVRVSVVRPGPTATGMGTDWSHEEFARLVDDWARWGIARHDNLLRPAAIADAVAYIVAMPRGTHARLIEIEPEAPIRSVEDDP